MSVYFNYDKFPLIEIKLGGNFNDDEKFEEILKELFEIFSKKKKFNLLIDIENCGNVSFKYCFQMAEFIKKIKDENISYLDECTIKLSNVSSNFSIIIT